MTSGLSPASWIPRRRTPAAGSRIWDCVFTELPDRLDRVQCPGESDPRDHGVYVHVPFCSRRCDYCAFATWTDRGHLIGRYLSAVRREVDVAVAAGMVPAATVFVGGGTPSLVPAPRLADVLRGIPLQPRAEVTVECNPDTVTRELLECYADAGVNRISLGVQSMVPSVLAALGRSHNPDNVRRAVELINEVGFQSFNLDLIYGAVGETVDDWFASVAEALALEPPHVSAYDLTVEAGTP